MTRRFIIMTAITFSFIFGSNIVSGGKLSVAQSLMDVKRYSLDLRIEPNKKAISGSVDIVFQIFQKTDFLEIDLVNAYSVSGTSVNGMSLAFEHKKNKIFIDNPGLDLFKEHVLKIKYGGKPPIAKNPPWDGGFTWERSDDGSHWVGISCQSNGAHIWYPCKEHPSDKANGADIKITTPPQLIAVSNGVLQSHETQEDRWVKWHWKTDYPISAYNINITIGKFNIIEKTSYLFDEPLKMVFYVLPEKENGAQLLLSSAEKHLVFYSKNFGPYPWIKEKFGLVHTPYLGMEHQTINAYGNNYKKTKLGYDFILFHEMGHEWWGNFLSVSDWADFWIHEGIDTYAEAMYIEQDYGIEAAKVFVEERFKKNIKNEAPVVPEKNATTKQRSGNDVYYKAAHILHTLRFLIGKDLLWSSLKEYVQMPKDLTNNQTSTDEFISLINENTKTNLNWFFDQYLYSKDLPSLEVKENLIKDKKFIDLRWKDKGFKMPIELHYISFDGKREKRIELNNTPKRIVIPASSELIIDPNGWLLFSVDPNNTKKG